MDVAKVVKEAEERRSVPVRLLGAVGVRRRLSPHELQDSLLGISFEDAEEPDDLIHKLNNAFYLTLDIGRSIQARYRRWARHRRGLSYGARVLGLLGLAVGVISPLAIPLLREGWQAMAGSVGYIGIAAGGLLMLADRVFVATGGWTRMVLADVTIEDRIVGLLYDWKGKQVRWKQRPPTLDDAASELLYLKDAADGFLEDYKTERKAWGDTVLAGSTELARQLNLETLTKKAAEQAAQRLTAQVADPRSTASRGRESTLQVLVDFTGAPPGAFLLVALGAPGEPQPDEQRLESTLPLAVFTAPTGPRVLTLRWDGQEETEVVTLVRGVQDRAFAPWK